MCILSPNDDMTAPSLRDTVTEAFARLDKAHAAVLRLALRLDEGDTASDFAGIHADAQIRRTLGEMHAARYVADEALCSLMKGETYRARPTSQAQAYELTARMIRNGGAVQARVLPGLPATVSPCAAE